MNGKVAFGVRRLWRTPDLSTNTWAALEYLVRDYGTRFVVKGEQDGETVYMLTPRGVELVLGVKGIRRQYGEGV